MTQKKEFTNRHGKKITVQEQHVTVTHTGEDNKQATSRRLSIPHISFPRIVVKRLAIVLIIAIIGFAVAIIVTADSVKRDYERQTSAMTRSVFEWGNRATSAETTATDQLAEMDKALSANTTCQVEGIDVVSWYGPAKNARETCQTTADTYVKLHATIEDMTLINDYITKVNSALEPALALPGEGEFAIISEYSSSWNEAAVALQNISPPEPLTKDHAVLIAKTRAVASAWTQLQAANSDQNTGAFKTAESGLSQAYTEFRTTSEGASILLRSAQSSLIQYADEINQ